jgi:hypothetical protein
MTTNCVNLIVDFFGDDIDWYRRHCEERQAATGLQNGRKPPRHTPVCG